MKAFIFDVDGVLNTIENREVPKPETVVLLISLLQQGFPLGFISGRGLLGLRSHVIKIFEKYVRKHLTLNKSILDLMYVSGEFGGVSATHVNGESREAINKEFNMTEALKDQLTAHAQQFDKYVFVETEKQTIFTLQSNHEISQAVYFEHRPEIVASFENFIKNYPELEVQADSVAINIRYKKANKKYATDQFLIWLKEKGIAPEKYYVFGDSPSDLEMGEALQSRQLPFEFIYVGDQVELKLSSYTFPLRITRAHYDEGTLEYLKISL